MLLLCFNMDSKLRGVLPQIMGKVLLCCRSMQVELKIAMATVRLVSLFFWCTCCLIIYIKEEK